MVLQCGRAPGGGGIERGRAASATEAHSPVQRRAQSARLVHGCLKLCRYTTRLIHDDIYVSPDTRSPLRVVHVKRFAVDKQRSSFHSSDWRPENGQELTVRYKLK